MKRVSLDQRGAMHLVALLVVLIIGAVAYAGYYVATHDKKPQNQQAQTSSEVANGGKFQSDSDLEQAATTLDRDETDTSLDPSQLDADLNSLL